MNMPDDIYRDKIYNNYVKLQSSKLHTHSLEEYERFSKFYSKKYSKFLPNDKLARILDIGCGPGFFLYYLKKEGYDNAIGLDLSAEQIDLAKSFKLNAHVGEMFDFMSNNPSEFELIFSSHVIEHLKKKEVIDYLTSIHKCLKSGGKTIICTPNANALFGFAYHSGDITHETSFSPISLRIVMEACGFRDIEILPEWPVAIDFQSTTRVILWNIIKPIIKALFVIQSGTDLLRSGNLLLENYMFAVGRKE